MANTNKQTRTSNKPAADKGASAKRKAQAQNATARESADESETADESGKVSQWAAELARVHGGSGTAAKRFTKLADYLCNDVAKPGTTARVSFAAANKACGLNRGATGDAGNSWRLAVQRTRQIFGGALPNGVTVAIEPDSQQIAVTMPK
jgi:hypothetical protein